jgi:glycosyltransferase involved in cell wall biosynthesis
MTNNNPLNGGDKIKVLCLPSDQSGVGRYRSVDPHVMLQEMYGDEFHVDIDYKPNINDANYWRQYDIVHVHRNIGHSYEQNLEIMDFLKKEGIVTVYDIDDYWLPTKEHPIHTLIVKHKIHEKIVANLKKADYVTTTTNVFASEIMKFNKNVHIFPNAINPDEKQFNVPTLECDKVRVGWIGGSSHYHDLKLLDGFIGKNASINKDIQYVLCGFDTRGSVTEINPKTGEERKRDIKPEETVWTKYEAIFTNNYKTIDENHLKFLNQYKDEEYVSDYTLPYRRVWTLPVNTYASHYSKIDISLAPIKNHVFNRMKSQLKVIEAGFYKKALIASNVGPYTIDLTHSLKNGIFGDGNALLVDEVRSHSDWAKYIKKLVENPNLVKDMGERLYETVKDTYDLRTVTKNRREFYKSIVNVKTTNNQNLVHGY